MLSFQPVPRFVSEDVLLLDEFTHRVNNELASAIAAIALACDRRADCDTHQLLQQLRLRMENYAMLQHALQRPHVDTEIDAATYFRQLCSAIRLSKLLYTGIELALVDRPLPMRATLCWRLGIIATELISNAARHAFESGGFIRVDLFRDRETVECRVTDNGRGSTEIRPGLGLTIVEALTKIVHGKMHHYSDGSGTMWTITVPSGSM